MKSIVLLIIVLFRCLHRTNRILNLVRDSKKEETSVCIVITRCV